VKFRAIRSQLPRQKKKWRHRHATLKSCASGHFHMRAQPASASTDLNKEADSGSPSARGTSFTAADRAIE
jgi:hypothetical protein